MTFPSSRLRHAYAIAIALFLFALFACNVTTEDGHTFLNIKNDTAWAKYDTLEITWKDTTTGAGGTLFRGDPDDLAGVNKFQVDGYQGGKLKVTFKGYSGKSLVFEELRIFDGANPGSSTKEIVPIDIPVLPGLLKPKPPRISDLTGPSILSIGDSASFQATAITDSGTLKSFAWNYEIVDTFAPATVLAGKSAVIKGGHRYANPGSYTVELKVVSEFDSIALAQAQIEIVVDSPSCDAGRDITVFTNGIIRLNGSGTDKYGKIVKTEWKIGSGPLSVTPFDTAFSAPGTSQEITALLRVTDDDGQIAMDSLKVHVISENESNLTGLGVSKGRLIPEFDPTILAYSDTVPYNTATITLSPTGSGTIKVNTIPVESGKPSSAIELKVGPNTITTSVQFEETRGKIYSLTVYRRPVSENAELSALVVSAGILDTAFMSGDTSYKVTAPNTTLSTTIKAKLADTTSTLTINGFTVASNALSGVIDLAVGINTINLEVTSQSGEKKTYVVQVNRAGNGNANLAGLVLSVGNINPNFNAGTIDYALSVANDAETTKVTATTENSTATLTINDLPVKSGIPLDLPLSVGATPILVKVTAQNGVEKTYKVQVTRAGNGNADLSGLTVSAGAIDPVFSPDAVFYSLAVANSIDSTMVTATVGLATSTLAIDNNTVASGAGVPVKLKVGTNSISVVVAAQNGDKKTYTIAITRAPNPNSDLSSLIVSNGSLKPLFGKGTLAYEVIVENSMKTITIEAKPSASTSVWSLSVNGVLVDSAAKESPIPLHTGANKITLSVIAENGSKTDYVVVVTRKPNSDATLSGLVITPGALDSAFSSFDTAYVVNLINAVDSIRVTPTRTIETTGIIVNGKPVASGAASEPIPLAIGSTTIVVVTTAEDLATKTYRITAIRAKNSNANLSSLAFNPDIGVPTYDPSTLKYSITVPNSTLNTRFVPIAAALTSTITVNGAPVASGALSDPINLLVGENAIPLVVTAQDGNSKAYSAKITRASNSNADLSELKISSAVPMSPVFTTGRLSYSLPIGNAESTLTVTPKALLSTSTISVNGSPLGAGASFGPINLKVGDTQIDIEVTAEDKVTKKGYYIVVNRAKNGNADLAGLSFSAGALSIPFSGSTLSYAFEVSNIIPSTTVTVKAANINSVIKVNNKMVASGGTSTGIGLDFGLNDIVVDIVAEDGTAKQYKTRIKKNRKIKAFAAGANFDLVLLEDSTVAAWGANGHLAAQVPAGLTGIVAISAGVDHALGLKKNGTVVAWGLDANGQTTIPAGLSDVKSIVAGEYFSAALKNDGTFVYWGDTTILAEKKLGTVPGPASLAAGNQHILALTESGSVLAFGPYSWGQTAVPPDLGLATAVAAGRYWSMALKVDGSIAAWGRNDGNPISNAPKTSGFIAISAGVGYGAAIKSDGSVTMWGGYPMPPSGLSNIKSVSSSYFHTLALKEDGTLVEWGIYSNGGIAEVPQGY